MKELIKLSDNLLNMKSNLDRMIDELWHRKEPDFREENQETWTPDVTAIEKKDEIKLYVSLPFAKKENININIKENILSIEGETKLNLDKEDNSLREEIPLGKFSRSFRINFPIKNDEIKASYKDGVLEIKLPKAESAKSNRINIE